MKFAFLKSISGAHLMGPQAVDIFHLNNMGFSEFSAFQVFRGLNDMEHFFTRNMFYFRGHSNDTRDF